MISEKLYENGLIVDSVRVTLIIQQQTITKDTF